MTNSNTILPAFSAFYLQQVTQEFSDDLDKVRMADDFKTDSIGFLVHSLQQGSSLFSIEEQAKIVGTSASTAINNSTVEHDQPSSPVTSSSSATSSSTSGSDSE